MCGFRRSGLRGLAVSARLCVLIAAGTLAFMCLPSHIVRRLLFPQRGV